MLYLVEMPWQNDTGGPSVAAVETRKHVPHPTAFVYIPIFLQPPIPDRDVNIASHRHLSVDTFTS